MQTPPTPPPPPGVVLTRLSLEQAETQAIRAAKKRYSAAKGATFALDSGRLAGVAGVLIYECAVIVRWRVPEELNFWGRVKVPAVNVRREVLVQIDALTGETVGISETP